MTFSGTSSNPADYVEHVSPLAFAPTVERLVAAIESAGLAIFARVDHAAAAHSVGMAMPPTLVLIYGNPRGGTPIMLAAPRAALDLPLRVLVREDAGGGVLVGFHPMTVVLRVPACPTISRHDSNRRRLCSSTLWYRGGRNHECDDD